MRILHATTAETVSTEAKHVYRETLTIKYRVAQELKPSMDIDDDCNIKNILAQILLCNTSGEHAGGAWSGIEEAWYWMENRTLQPSLGSVASDDGSDVLKEIREMLPLVPHCRHFE